LSGRRKKKKNRKRSDNTHKPGISLCMIVRDEQENLPRCIKSVKPILSEIVVVDTGSTDDTVAVAKAHGARVVSNPWNNDFSAARNVSLRNATQKWILILDADEVLDRKNLPGIAALCTGTEFEAFRFLTRNYLAENTWYDLLPNDGKLPQASRYPGWYPSCKVRLFRNDERVRFSGELHELVEPSLEELDWKIGEAPFPVHHLTWKSREGLRDKKVLYQECAGKKVLKNPSDAKALYEYGVECSGIDEHDLAVDAFSKALHVAPDFTNRYPGLPDIHGYLAANLIKQSHYEEALSRIDDGLLNDPGNSSLLHLRGISYLGLGRMEEAISSLEKAVENNPRFGKGFETLGIAWRRAGENARAADSLRRALELNPGLSEAKRLLESMSPASGSKKVKLSVCIIARDEEESLPECIESLQGLADEVVVVDTGSIDGTVDRAEALGARVFHFDWCDDFSAARNESIRRARGDYILWLDADDRLHPDDLHKLALLKDNLPSDKKTAYLFLLHNKMNDLDGDMCYQLRLFPNLPGAAFQGRIHEQVVYSLEKLGASLHQADIRIVHTGYEDKAMMEAKIRRNIEILLQEEERNPGDFIGNFHLASSYFCLEEWERAIDYMKKAVYGDNDHRRSPFWHMTARVQLGWMYKNAGMNREASKTLEEALAMDSTHPVARLLMGEIDYSDGRYEDALEILSSVDDEDFQPTVFAASIDKMRHHLHLLRAKCSEELGNYPEAATEYEAALALNSESAAAMKGLGSVHLKQGKYGEAEEVLRSFEGSDDPEALANLGVIDFRRGDALSAERKYRKALELNPDLVEARVNLGHLLLEQDRFKEARYQFEEVAERNDSWVDVHLGLSRALAAEGDVEGCVYECDRAMDLLEFPRDQVLNSVADLSGLYLAMSEELKEKNRYKEALLALETASILNPRCAETQKRLASLYEQRGMHEKALDCYEKALLASPSRGEILTSMSGCYRSMGAVEAAELCLQKAEQLASAHQ